jgi:hypothetical protein
MTLCMCVCMYRFNKTYLTKLWDVVKHTETVKKLCMNEGLKWSHFRTVAVLKFSIFEDNSLSSIPFFFFLIVYKCTALSHVKAVMS